MKKWWALLLGAVVLAVGSAGVIGWKSFPKEDSFFVTTLSISDIADKQQADDYTLTLVLEDSLVQEYGLPDRQLTLSAKDSLWQQVEPQSGFVGATLEVTIPAGQPKSDLGMILREGKTSYCQVTSVTTQDNVVLE